jgi:hypothetical protein
MATIEAEAARTGEPQKRALDSQLERIGWGLFLIMIGGLALVPKGLVPEGVWLVGTGLIMLGLNVARRLNGIRVSGFTVVLGLAALAAGLSAVAGVSLPVFPILLIALGAQILYGVSRQHND